MSGILSTGEEIKFLPPRDRDTVAQTKRHIYTDTDTVAAVAVTQTKGHIYTDRDTETE